MEYTPLVPISASKYKVLNALLTFWDVCMDIYSSTTGLLLSDFISWPTCGSGFTLSSSFDLKGVISVMGSENVSLRQTHTLVQP